MSEKDFMPSNQTIDTQILLDFTLDVLGGKAQPIKKEQMVKSSFDAKGFRVYNSKALDNHFPGKAYLEKEILICFYDSKEEDLVNMEVLSQLALEMRK